MAVILLVDDDEKILELMSEIIEDLGHSPVSAKSGKEAFGVLQNQQIDLTITDIVMPDIDGMQVISHIRSHYPGMKVIAMSGGAKAGPDSYLPLAKTLGADLVIEKPFSLDELSSEIEALID